MPSAVLALLLVAGAFAAVLLPGVSTFSRWVAIVACLLIADGSTMHSVIALYLPIFQMADALQ